MGFEIENGVLKRYTEEPGVCEAIIPDSVTEIRHKAFYHCTNLTSIVIPDSVTKIGDWAFEYCDKLTITAPAGGYAERYAKQHRIPFAAK